MTSSKQRVVILGAGITGLSCAYHLLNHEAFDVVVLEKMDRVGGLATSFQLGPVVFDFGPHAFHSQQPHIIEFFQTVMAGQYFEIQKNVAIKFDGTLYPYPLNPVLALRRMPLLTSIRCGVSYLRTFLSFSSRKAPLKTAEQFFVRNFGWELYRLFFEGYTHKVWGIHPRELSVKFIQNRLPSANIFRIAWAALVGSDIKTHRPNEVPLKLRIFYPKQGSIQFPETLRKEIERRGGRILLNSDLQTVTLSNGRAASVEYSQSGQAQSLACDTVISTIPMPHLIKSIRPSLSEEIVQASEKLSFRPILIVCLWIDKPTIFSYQTIYYTNRIFNRLAQMNSYSATTTPPGTCGVTAELTCQAGDAVWTMPESELLKKVIADMALEGLIAPGDVKEGMVLRNLHGYPIYHVGFEDHLTRLRNALRGIPNLYAAGRQGMFNYAQMHYGVSAGLEIAKHLSTGRSKITTSTGDDEELLFT